MSYTEEEIQSRCLQWYTHAFPLKEVVRITHLECITDGWESDLYALTLTWTQASGHTSEEVMLKLYYGERGRLLAQHEALALTHLSARGFPVPRLRLSALEQSPFGRPAVLMQRIARRRMDEALRASPPPQQRELLTRFCQLLVDLHALDWTPFVQDPVCPHPAKVLATWLSEERARLSELHIPTFDPVLAWLAAKSADVVCERLSVIHGDYHPWNVLLQEDGTAVVIDWTGLAVSDYRFDLARTLLLLETQGYPDLRDIILHLYGRLAGQIVEQIEFFEVIGCLRRLIDISVSLSQGATRMGMKPEATALMKQQAGPIHSVYVVLQQRTGLALPAIEQLLSTLA